MHFLFGWVIFHLHGFGFTTHNVSLLILNLMINSSLVNNSRSFWIWETSMWKFWTQKGKKEGLVNSCQYRFNGWTMEKVSRLILLYY